MSPSKPSDFPVLLQVYLCCLRSGLISRNEVVAWADEIIGEENEPDYFFIEVSLSKDLNDLVIILNQYISGPINIIAVRAIYGIIYTRLINREIELDKAINFVDIYGYHEVLTRFESNNIYSLDYYLYGEPVITGEMTQDTIAILSYYKDFNLQNYDQWTTINSGVEEVIREAQVKADIANEAFQKTWKKKEAKRKLIRLIPITIIFLIALIVIIVDLVTLITGTTHPERIWYLNIWGIYVVVRWGYRFWRKMRS